MLKNFTACYRKLEHGYMGKILEWPGVITEGDDLEDCRELLKEAATEMAEIYKDDGREIPYAPLILEPISVSVAPECLPREEALLVNVS
ncbi:MAG: type II toxin-antitoxin system HicB family antitoxin [Synergistaceae bacterium]|nr:type II toxin-antitoxin system HicB family antitoxin [Synergistaceae bacterium]